MSNGNRVNNWEEHFSSPLRAAETISKAKEVCAGEHPLCADCIFRAAPACLADPALAGTEEELLAWMLQEVSA